MRRLAVLFLVLIVSCVARPRQGSFRSGTAPTGDLDTLVAATREGRLDEMALVLDRGADPNGRDGRNGWTPLLHAIHKSRPDAVRLLLRRHADPNLPSAHGGMTPLVMAAMYGYDGIVRDLLAAGASTRLRTSNGTTPLAAAVGGSNDIDRCTLGRCQTSTVKAILAADPTAPMDDATSLRVARLAGCDEVVLAVERRAR